MPTPKSHSPNRRAYLGTLNAGKHAFAADAPHPDKIDWSGVDAYMAAHQGDDLTLVRDERGYVMRLIRRVGARVEVVREKVIGHEPKPLRLTLVAGAAKELTR